MQGLEQLSEEPVLLTVLHRYLSSGDATASPRIAAKAKSSIAAKPGGGLLVEQHFEYADVVLKSFATRQ